MIYYFVHSRAQIMKFFRLKILKSVLMIMKVHLRMSRMFSYCSVWRLNEFEIAAWMLFFNNTNQHNLHFSIIKLKSQKFK